MSRRDKITVFWGFYGKKLRHGEGKMPKVVTNVVADTSVSTP
jgi:hypothetical protein